MTKIIMEKKKKSNSCATCKRGTYIFQNHFEMAPETQR